jgi:hypothetical protein
VLIKQKSKNNIKGGTTQSSQAAIHRKQQIKILMQTAGEASVSIYE